MQCSFKWLLLFKKGIRGNRPYDFLLLFLQQRKQLFSTYFYKINHTHYSFFFTVIDALAALFSTTRSVHL